MRGSRGKRGSSFTWVLVAKTALTIALALPTSQRGTVDYRSLSALPGVRAGTPVTVFGQTIGQVVSTHRIADTTLITVRFDRPAIRTLASRVVVVRWMGLEQGVALDFQLVRREGPRVLVQDGWLRVLPTSPSPHVQPEVAPPPGPAPERRFPDHIPTVPVAPRQGRLASA